MFDESQVGHKLIASRVDNGNVVRKQKMVKLSDEEKTAQADDWNESTQDNAARDVATERKRMIDSRMSEIAEAQLISEGEIE